MALPWAVDKAPLWGFGHGVAMGYGYGDPVGLLKCAPTAQSMAAQGNALGIE